MDLIVYRCLLPFSLKTVRPFLRASCGLCSACSLPCLGGSHSAGPWGHPEGAEPWVGAQSTASGCRGAQGAVDWGGVRGGQGLTPPQVVFPAAGSSQACRQRGSPAPGGID